MARAGNLNLKGSVRCEIIAGPDVQFVEATNSGIFTSVSRTGVGVYEIVMADGGLLEPSDVVELQVEGTAPGIANSVSTAALLTVTTFDDGAIPAAADLPFSVRVVERFLG